MDCGISQLSRMDAEIARLIAEVLDVHHMIVLTDIHFHHAIAQKEKTTDL